MLDGMAWDGGEEGGEAEDGAAVAASATIDALVAACEHEQILGGGEEIDGYEGEAKGGSSGGASTLLPLFLRLLSLKTEYAER